MDTVPIDLLKLIDQYLDAKSSALIGISTGLELFLSEYDEFDFNQWKWIACFIYQHRSIRLERGTIIRRLYKKIDSGTIIFILEHFYDGLPVYFTNSVNLKLIEEGRSSKCKEIDSNTDIYTLSKYIRQSIKYDRFEYVEILTNLLIERFGIDCADYVYGDYYLLITRLLIYSHQKKNQKCIDYFESLCARCNLGKADRLMLLIGLLSWDSQVLDDRTKLLLDELRGDMDLIDLIFHEVLSKGYNRGVDLILDLIDGSTLRDKLQTICKCIEDIELYTDPTQVFFSSALSGNNIKMIEEIIAMTNNDQELYYLALEAYNYCKPVNKYKICDMIFDKSVGVRTIFQIKVNNIGMKFFSDGDIAAQLRVNSADCFDYIISRFGCHFDIDYVQKEAYRKADLKLFKRVVDFKNELIL